MDSPLIINGVRVARGQAKRINLNVARLPTRTLIHIPVHVFRARKKGPTLLLLAGTHGDEVNGIEILRRLIVTSAARPATGTVIAIPVLNIYGFINFSREVPGHKDVNRSFPGNETGSLASRVAHRFTHEILPHVDVGLDFHSGGRAINNYPQIRCLLDAPQNATLAKAFGAPFVINARLIHRSLRKEGQKLSKPILVYEGGESMRFNEFAIREGIRGTLRLMRHLGMKEEAEVPAGPVVETRFFDRSTWVRARLSGTFRAFVENGVRVKSGQVLGAISEPYGGREFRVRAPAAGFVVAVNSLPVVHQGDALVHLGFE